MNTNVYFVFLLAIGLSAKSEFLADFNEIIKLKDGKTYLVSNSIHATDLTLLI